MLLPATDLVCRKKRILSTLVDRICHQAPRSMEIVAIRSSLAVSKASCRHPIQMLSGFEEEAICCNNIRRTNYLAFFENDVKVLRSTKNAPASSTIAVSKRPPPNKTTRAGLLEMCGRAVDLNIPQDQTPELALISLL